MVTDIDIIKAKKHLKNRFYYRFGVSISEADIREMVRQINEGEANLLAVQERDGDVRLIFEIYINDFPYTVAYSTKLGIPLTVLPHSDIRFRFKISNRYPNAG